ncbi:hypothetical protein PAEPH01_2566 [Pancytospora epiphaga]|nr:hypothetical protein PAEPH01_2566 [Pancytospora epiphaga]
MQVLNNIVVDVEYSILNMQHIIENTCGIKYFTAIDLKDDYYQICLKNEDRYTRQRSNLRTDCIHRHGCHKNLKTPGGIVKDNGQHTERYALENALYI